MQEGYFKTAWNDIKNTPEWIRKMFLLALIAWIPVFGAITVSGYLYGWARDIAWGVQSPMPKHIFGNEDGKLYSRGFFILVLGIVLALIPGIIYAVGIVFASVGAVGSHYGMGRILGSFGIFYFIFSLVYIVLILAVSLFQLVGSMRITIYGQLSAGFQFKKIWSMMRKDTPGLLKILGMSLLLSLIWGAIISIVLFLIIAIFTAIAFASFSGSPSYIYSGHLDLAPLLAFGGVTVIFYLVFCYLVMVPGMWVSALTTRALGYWTRQFDVPAWRGQEDPMPFELHQVTQGQQPQAPYQQNYQPQVPPQPYGQSTPQQPYEQAPVVQPGAVHKEP